MTEPLYFDQLEVGQSWKSESRAITSDDVAQFAALTGDFDPLHTDPAFAATTPFGRPIAHGLLGMSIVAGLGSANPRVHTSAFVQMRDWQFLKPIYFGDEVHAVAEVIAKERRGRRRGLVAWKRQLVNQRGEVVQEGVFETLVEVAKSAVPAPHMKVKTAAVPD